VQANEAGVLPERIKLDAYRQAKPGVWEWWATYNLQINTEKPPEGVSSSIGATSSGAGTNENAPRQAQHGGDSGASEGKAAAAPVRGKRYRLLPLSESLQRALPADGKLAVLYGGHTCEAQLRLPASDTRQVAGRGLYG
jgi:hypothetical protein